MESLHHAHYPSPFGQLHLTANDQALLSVCLASNGERETTDSTAHPVLRSALKQLEEYFSGSRTLFEIPLEPMGTEFQKRCWEALCHIPYGETRHYGDLISSPKHARAVGQALHQNPILIFIPCHRVRRSTGHLGGFRAGLEAKEFLLKLEGLL